MVWQAERELAQAEAEFDELLTDIDRLSQVKEAILNSRQFRIVARCTAGIGPQLRHEHGKLMELLGKVKELQAEYLTSVSSTFSSAWRRRTIASNLLNTARSRYNESLSKATTKDKHDIHYLRHKFNAGRIDDPVMLELLGLVKESAVAKKFQPCKVDHYGEEISYRPEPWMRWVFSHDVDEMPLPEFQGVSLPEITKEVAAEYRLKLKELGIKPSAIRTGDRPQGHLCDCGASMERGQIYCQVCKRYYRRGGKADTSETIGRETEPSWHRLDRSLAEWSLGKAIANGEVRDGELPYYSNSYDQIGEHGAALIGLRNQVTRDAEDVLDAQRSYGPGWKDVGWHLERSIPYHGNLGNLGSGQQDDLDDPGFWQDISNPKSDDES